MIFLVFETEEAAFLAESQISSNMGLVLPEHWAFIRPRQDSKFGFKKPQEQYMTGVTGYTEEAYDPQMYHIDNTTEE